MKKIQRQTDLEKEHGEHMKILQVDIYFSDGRKDTEEVCNVSRHYLAGNLISFACFATWREILIL